MTFYVIVFIVAMVLAGLIGYIMNDKEGWLYDDDETREDFDDIQDKQD